jgi:AcrR family transcriptional regulator
LSNDRREKAESKLAAQAARTRKRLIDATLELLPKYSIHTLSLDVIAKHVGMTKGAVYGHFPSKQALIAVAIGTRPGLRPDLIGWPTTRKGSVRARLRRLGEAVIASARDSSAFAPAATELILQGFSDEAGRRQRRELGQQLRAQIEAKVEALFAREELPMPPAAFALLVSLLVPGLMFARAYEETAIDDATVLAMFEGLAGPAEDAPRRRPR